MATVKTNSQYYTDIANAIRNKNGSTTTYKPSEMANAINSIPAGSFTLETYLTNKQYSSNSCNDFYYFFAYSDMSMISDTLISEINTIINKKYKGSSLNLNYMFSSNLSLVTAPLIDLSVFPYKNKYNINLYADCKGMFYKCSNLSNIPTMNLSGCNNVSYMFSSCTSLTNIPNLILENSYDLNNMFGESGIINGSNLSINCTGIPTSSNVSCYRTFYNCYNLTSAPSFNFPSYVKSCSFQETFSGCKNLVSFPNCNFPTSIDNSYFHFQQIFYNCKKLESIGTGDISAVTTLTKSFEFCENLKTILWTNFKVSFNISYSTKFETSNLVTILNNLGTVTSATTLTMGSTNLSKLSDTQKAIATNKGWTLA